MRIAGYRTGEAGDSTEGDIDLRGFFGLDATVAAGYQELRSTVVIKGDGTEEQFRKIHDMVLATSPNFYNITHAVRVASELTIEQPEIACTEGLGGPGATDRRRRSSVRPLTIRSGKTRSQWMAIGLEARPAVPAGRRMRPTGRTICLLIHRMILLARSKAEMLGS